MISFRNLKNMEYFSKKKKKKQKQKDNKKLINL
jgi:hypothetical protein